MRQSVAMQLFDQKFGQAFLESVPSEPGIYRFKDQQGLVIYVGKAKNLRRRLAQYRLAGKLKKHRRMRGIVKEASSLEAEVCSTELAAETLEIRQIQLLRPRWNIVSAYYRNYPFFGLREQGADLHICLVLKREAHDAFNFFGVFRSRLLSVAAFDALHELLSIVGQKTYIVRKTSGHSRLDCQLGFRGIEGQSEWAAFFRGESMDALKSLAVALLEHRKARISSESIQIHLRTLREFWRDEAEPLAQALKQSAYATYPVEQADRDILFMEARTKSRLQLGPSVLS